MWWIIATANNINDANFYVEPGVQLRRGMMSAPKKKDNVTRNLVINGKEVERTSANYFDANTFAKLVFKK